MANQEQPFVAAKQVGFNLEDIILNPNNEVALLYLKHNNKDHFKCVSDFISKCVLLNPTGGIYGEVGVNTFRNIIGAYYLPHSSEYVAPPSIDIVRPWFETIGCGEAVPTKGTLKKSLLPPRWRLLMAQIIQCLGGTKPGAKLGHKKHSTSSKQSSVSSKEATKGGSSKAPTSSKTGHSKKRKESSSAMDSNPIQPLVSTLVDIGMHKEDQQHIYSTSFIIYSESALGNDVSAVSTAEADPRISAPRLETVFTQPITGKRASLVTRQTKEETSSSIKLEDLAKLVSHVQPSFKDLDSPKDDLVITVDDTDEDEEDEIHAATNDKTKDTSVPKSSSQTSQIQELTNQVLILPVLKAYKLLNELLVKSLKTKFSNILSTHDFSSSLLTELKDLPSKFNEMAEKVEGLKNQVHELKIELLGDLKEIPTKLKDFTKTVTSLTSQVIELKSLVNLLHMLLTNFLRSLTSASSKARVHSVPSAGLDDTRPTEGEKGTQYSSKPLHYKKKGHLVGTQKVSPKDENMMY
ncbi:hypothetical protein Tco_0988041 [Tanacetum coccineum]|uniref:Uncharacterized protein n=1 Tax=Tanacetum coccineum TaxID=301880 RepID=A0ABQ5EQD9_9ASTR